MADVGEIWHRARHDRAFREQLEHDPVSVLAGAGLNDDELALLDAALRASHPASAGDLFSLHPDTPSAPGRESDRTSLPTPPEPGGDPSADREEHP